MYSQDVNEITKGMVSYIGALVDASTLPLNTTRRAVNATLSKQILTLSESKNGEYDLYVIQPLLVATHIFLDKRIEQIKQDTDLVPDEIKKTLIEQLKAYTTVRDSLNSIIKKIDDNTREEF